MRTQLKSTPNVHRKIMPHLHAESYTVILAAVR